ncbi:MAG: hypothetical protein ACR2MB_14140 [Acidimicrobiales bacterium]
MPPPVHPELADARRPPLVAPVGSPEGDKRLGVPQFVAIALVVALVAGLFVFMALNGGPDEARERQLARANRLAEQRPPSTLATTTTTATPPAERKTALPASKQPGAEYVFPDQAKYCQGANGIAAFELRVVAGALERDWQRIRQDAIAGRSSWRAAVDAMILGGTSSLQADLLFYRDTYEKLIAGLTASTNETDIARAFESLPIAEVREAGARVNRATYRTCH